MNRDEVLTTWDVANDGMHDSNTDMIEWNGQCYLADVSSPYHFGTDTSALHVKYSPNQGRALTEVNAFNLPAEDLRDPEFAVIGRSLFLHALKNTSVVAESYLSVYAYTEDGRQWKDFQTVPALDGWLFWRPKTQDGVTFYNAAYWWERGKSMLLKSTNGIQLDILLHDL